MKKYEMYYHDSFLTTYAFYEGQILDLHLHHLEMLKVQPIKFLKNQTFFSRFSYGIKKYREVK